jgi:hypothetical protein
MRLSSHTLFALASGVILGLMPLSRVSADDTDKPSPAKKVTSSKKGDKAHSKADKASASSDQDIPELNLLDAVRDGLVAVEAEGKGDGRMTMTITNRTRRQLRVVLPPGIIAQGATGQFGGMGGGGMGGGGMGGGGMGGGMGGMGGGMGGMGGGMGGGGGGMGGMGGMGRQSGTMPPTMGMMMLARMIMYFCGDPESWDMRSLMIGMMGGMGGGMGGMGGGMGGMGGGMGGMGGGMRSVPPTSLPFTTLTAGQTRHLPTRLVSITAPDPEVGLVLPQEGEKLQILGDVAKVNDNPRVQKALRRLAAAKAPTSLAQLVMWRVSANLDWNTIAQLSQAWAGRHEITLAQYFVDHLDEATDGESGRLYFEAEGTDAASTAVAAELTKALEGKSILGVLAAAGIPAQPQSPALACRIRLTGTEASVQVTGTDASATKWIPFGKFAQPLVQENGKINFAKLGDSLAEGILNRLVRAQVIKNSAQREKGKLIHQIRIENASPLILNGLAVVGTGSKEDEMPKVLSGIAIPPRRTMLVPTNDDVVKTLGLKKGIKVLALDLSGL